MAPVQQQFYSHHREAGEKKHMMLVELFGEIKGVVLCYFITSIITVMDKYAFCLL